LHFPLFPWLETDGGAGCDIQMHAKGLCTIEPQTFVDLKEVIVRGHLDITV
jgi:hypothetical protein